MAGAAASRAEAELRPSIPAARSARDALAGGARVGILERDDDAGDARRGDQVGAGRAALAVVGAGLERGVERRALRSLAGLGQRHRFGMGAAAGRGGAAGRRSRRP